MKNSTKIIATLGLIGTVAIAGLARVYAAQSSNNPQVAEVKNGKVNSATEAAKILQFSTKNNGQSSKIAEASDGDGETNDDAKESQEAAKLQALAKITANQAQLAAESSVGAKAKSVKLENEDGNLVYAVIIGDKEVKVDAGNGKVLYSENANQENDKNDVSHPKSSIQVAETSDGDGETNDDGK